jgi:hypothetical protein
MKELLLIFGMLPLLASCPPTGLEQRDQIKFGVERELFFADPYSLEFSPENLMKVILYFDIKEPEIVFRQARIETAEFTSNIFRYGKNLFGMKVPKYRCTSAVGECRGHAQYVHFTDSVRDYKYWQDYYISRGWVTEDYLAFLWGIRYATDVTYIDKLKEIV